MVSVVIVNYNTRDLTVRCLEAVSKSRGIKPEIILVDNGSTDGTTDKIKKILGFKDIRIIQNDKNLGFGTANNQGMKIARGEHILLLNSDCFLKPDTLQISLDSMKKYQADVAGCKLINADGSVQQSWGYFPTLRRITQMMLFVDNLPVVRKMIDSIHVRDMSKYNQSSGVDWVTGAFMLLKRGVYENTGGFDEHFFMYGEEIEWQYRIKQQGHKIWYLQEAGAIHLVGASSTTRAPAVIGEIEGWKYWFAKYHPGWQEKAMRLIVFLGCLLRIVLKPKWAKFYKQALINIWR